MDNAITLNSNSSTTRLLTREKPILEQKPEYKIESKLFLPSNPERKGEGGLRTKGYFKKSYNNKPLISIVTVVYNGEKHLEQTINSVLEQGYENVEYIIIDGGSIDGTVDIIKKYKNQIDYWVSEPDSGIYDAMNKGASLCSGEYVAFLNADDWYELSVLQTVADNYIIKPVDYICGDVLIIDASSGIPRKTMDVDLKRYKIRMPLGHPSLFVGRQYILSFGFDLKYPIISDYDFAIKLVKKKLSMIYIPMSFTNFRTGGMSTTQNYANEHFLLYYNHFGLYHAIKYRFLLYTKYGRLLSAILIKIKKKIKYKE